jgi:acyl-CoA-binding protein
MSLSYDEILSDNVFGQIIIPAPQSSSSSMTNHSDNKTDEKEIKSLTEQYGFSIDELFNLARQFLKEKQGSKAIRLKYADNVRLIALSKQATIGKWDASYTKNVGLLDVVGNDRKQAWSALGNMSKEQAKEEFVKFLLECCPIFKLDLEAHHVEDEEKVRLKKEDEAHIVERQQAEQARKYEFEQLSYLEEQKRKREEFQRKQIQDALNQQTYPQFKAYAEQQFKDNRQAQDELIRQLQEQHYQQYMQQVYQQQLNYQQQQRMVRLVENIRK